MNYSKQLLQQTTGNIYQIMGAQKYTLDEGLAKGNSIIRVRNGLGLEFNITPDRGLDIFDIYFKGTPLAWISKNGLVGNQHYNDNGASWLRSFPGGMLNTCGMRNAGPPVDEQGEHFGLHGRVSNLPANHVGIKEHWQDEVYHIEVTGKVREARVFGENLLLERNIQVNSQNNEITIHDTIGNQGHQKEQVLLLYHLNWGFPLLSPKTELILDAIKTVVRDEHQQNELEKWNSFTHPIPGFQEVVYFHDLKPNKEGWVGYKLKNPEIATQVEVKWQKEKLPHLTQWKMTGQGEYVLGLEPGNCYPMGRVVERENKRSMFMDPGEIFTSTLKVIVSEI